MAPQGEGTFRVVDLKVGQSVMGSFDGTLSSDGHTARLTIRDQGIGISEEDRARIFQRFERAVVRREHGGFGVGLWVTNQLVTAMGGTISIESAPGQGSSFTVALPVSAAKPLGNTAT